jgi:hypothetical protein
MADDDADQVEIARITIVKSFDDRADGGAAVVTTYSDNLALIDALGMLAFATQMTVRTYLGDDREDES